MADYERKFDKNNLKLYKFFKICGYNNEKKSNQEQLKIMRLQNQI